MSTVGVALATAGSLGFAVLSAGLGRLGARAADGRAYELVALAVPAQVFTSRFGILLLALLLEELPLVDLPTIGEDTNTELVSGRVLPDVHLATVLFAADGSGIRHTNDGLLGP